MIVRSVDVRGTKQGSSGRARTGKPLRIGAKAAVNWGPSPIHHPWVITWRDSHSYDGPTTPRAAATRQSDAVQMRRDGGGVDDSGGRSGTRGDADGDVARLP